MGSTTIVYRDRNGWFNMHDTTERDVLDRARILYTWDAEEIIITVPGSDSASWSRGCRKHVKAKTWNGGGSCDLEKLHDGPCELLEDLANAADQELRRRVAAGDVDRATAALSLAVDPDGPTENERRYGPIEGRIIDRIDSRSRELRSRIGMDIPHAHSREKLVALEALREALTGETSISSIFDVTTRPRP